LHGFGQHMRAVMPDQFQRACIIAGDELDRHVFFDWIGEIAERAIQRHRHGALGQRWRDALGDIETGDAFGEFALGAVGEGDVDLVHGLGGLEIRNGILEVAHQSLLWLTPADQRR
jgi:hypothetical protein